jgi:hypothetical protein
MIRQAFLNCPEVILSLRSDDWISDERVGQVYQTLLCLRATTNSLVNA